MRDAESLGLKELGIRLEKVGEPHPRAFGSPLPVGDSGQAPQFQPDTHPKQPAAAPPPRALAAVPSPSPSLPQEREPSRWQRAAQALRAALPYVHRMLPLLDGHFATAVSNVLAPQQPALPAPPPDLDPIQDGLADLRMQQRDLRVQLINQNASLKRVEDRLETVREATDRNTLEQQELIVDLKAVSRKVNLFAILVFLLLAASIVMNVLLFTQVRHLIK
jgi:hypothetical protein